MSQTYFRIAPAKLTQHYFKKNATVADTLKLIKEYASKYNYQVSELAKQLDAPTVEEYCNNIWNFVKQNIAYKEDRKGTEQVRQPARTWADRFTGVDCDCYTTFISALLHLKNISHDYRVVSWTAPGKWAHIYPVAYDGNGNSYAIDCIPEISRFNQQLNFTDNMDLEGLAGASGELSDAELMQQAITINGFDGSDDYDGSEAVVLYGMVEAEKDDAGAIAFNGRQMEALNDKDILETLQGALLTLESENVKQTELSGIVNVPIELRNAGNLIKNWSDKAERERIIELLIQNSNFSDFYKNIKDQMDAGEQLRGLEDQYFVALEGYHDDDDSLGKFKPLKKLKASIKKVKDKIKKTAVGKVIGKIKKAVNKVSPHMIALRNGFLLVMKGDIGGHASFLRKGLYTQQEAAQRSIPLNEWQEAKAKYEKIANRFKEAGGEEKNLRNAILKGKAKGEPVTPQTPPNIRPDEVKPGLSGSDDMELGVAPIVAAALKVIQGIIGVVKKAKDKAKAKREEKNNQQQQESEYQPGSSIGTVGDEGGSGEANELDTTDDKPKLPGEGQFSPGMTSQNNLVSEDFSNARPEKRTITDTTKNEPDTTDKENENLNNKTMADTKTTEAAQDDRPFLKRMWQDHKWWVIGGTLGLALLILLIVWMKNRAKKKKANALAGARRRAKQQQQQSRPSYRRRAPKALNGPLMLAGPKKKRNKAVKKKR